VQRFNINTEKLKWRKLKRKLTSEINPLNNHRIHERGAGSEEKSTWWEGFVEQPGLSLE